MYGCELNSILTFSRLEVLAARMFVLLGKIVFLNHYVKTFFFSTIPFAVFRKCTHKVNATTRMETITDYRRLPMDMDSLCVIYIYSVYGGQ